MNESIAATLQSAVRAELGRRFDLDDGTMAEYVVVMLQNGMNAPGMTAELSDLVPNFDASFTQWVFSQVSRLQSGLPIEAPEGPAEVRVQDQDMSESDNGTAGEQGMGYPNPRIYADLKKTLQSNNNDNTEAPQSRHRPDSEGVRSSPYGTVSVGNGAMRIPTGPRNNGPQQKSSTAGPMRTNRQRPDKGSLRNNHNGAAGLPEMPQFPGFPPFPMPDLFANMPLASRIDGGHGAGLGSARPPTRRCTKWPVCFKGKACTFGHPTTMCQNPSCRKVDGSCPSVHADEDIDLSSGVAAQSRTEEELEVKAAARANKFKQKVQMNAVRSGLAPASLDGSTPICKFGEACTNRTCHFSHPSPASKNGSSIVVHSEMCNQGMECKDEQCSYSHPSPSNQYTPGVKLNTMSAEIQCKFHPCLNPSCRFQHSAGQKSGPAPTFGGARNKVWTPNSAKPATAERLYVDGEAEEQFTSGSNLHDNDTEMEK